MSTCIANASVFRHCLGSQDINIKKIVCALKEPVLQGTVF